MVKVVALSKLFRSIISFLCVGGLVARDKLGDLPSFGLIGLIMGFRSVERSLSLIFLGSLGSSFSFLSSSPFFFSSDSFLTLSLTRLTRPSSSSFRCFDLSSSCLAFSAAFRQRSCSCLFCIQSSIAFFRFSSISLEFSSSCFKLSSSYFFFYIASIRLCSSRFLM